MTIDELREGLIMHYTYGYVTGRQTPDERLVMQSKSKNSSEISLTIEDDNVKIKLDPPHGCNPILFPILPDKKETFSKLSRAIFNIMHD